MQILFPDKGDWYLQVRKDLNDFDLPEDLYFYEDMSEKKFKDLVKGRATDYAVQKFQQKMRNHSKMKRLFRFSEKVFNHGCRYVRDNHR